MDNGNCSRSIAKCCVGWDARRRRHNFFFETPTPAIIVADAVTLLNFLAEGASIEEESEFFDDVNCGCDDESRS